MLELHKIIIVPHAVACSIIFALFFDQGCQGIVFKVIKKDFFCF